MLVAIRLAGGSKKNLVFPKEGNPKGCGNSFSSSSEELVYESIEDSLSLSSLDEMSSLYSRHDVSETFTD